MKEVLVIAGTTASGKSSLALQLAKKVNGYIINADSRQIYKEIPICTAQPVWEKYRKDNVGFIENIEHYLYRHIELNQEYNIYQFQKDVNSILKLKESSNQTPILVGGTGLYIDSVVYNYNLNNTYKPQYSREYLSGLSLSMLIDLAGDKINSLNESDRNNPRRIIRLIEKSDNIPSKGKTLTHKYYVIDIAQEQLEKNIHKRIEMMFEMGIEKENREVWEKYKDNMPKALDTIGFSEFIPYFNGETSLEEVKELIFIHTRQYAKKQRTWFKRNKEVIHIKSADEVIRS